MGRVYLGVDPDGHAAAVKVIHESLAGNEQFRRRFGREVAAARRIRSPRVAEVIAADPDAERPWMATTYIRGKNLQQVIETDEDEPVLVPLPVPAVLALAAGVSEALIQIHAAGVVHRDLKPTNILLAADGPKVIDFGIARAAEMSTVTVLGEITGSAGFMSPEQMQGAEIGPPSDMFSLGSVLFVAATGTYAFGTGSFASALYRIVHEEPDLSAVAEPHLRSIIAGCLEKEPARRLTPQQVLEIARPAVSDVKTGNVIVVHETAGDRGPRNGPTTVNGSAKVGNAPRRGSSVRQASLLVASAVVLIVATGTFLVYRHLNPADASGSASGGVSSPVVSVPSTTGPASPTSDTSSPAAASSSASKSPKPAPKPTIPRRVATFVPAPTASTASRSATPKPSASESAKAKTANAVEYTSTPLSAPPGLTARAYFGRLGGVTSAASDVSFALDSDVRSANADRCVLTVVFRKVEGSDAAVYANGLGSGWPAAEDQPSQDASEDGGAVHQQLITPPTGTNVGSSWNGRSFLRVDGTDYGSGTYTLQHKSGEDQDGVWTFSGTPVSCSVY